MGLATSAYALPSCAQDISVVSRHIPSSVAPANDQVYLALINSGSSLFQNCSSITGAGYQTHCDDLDVACSRSKYQGNLSVSLQSSANFSQHGDDRGEGRSYERISDENVRKERGNQFPCPFHGRLGLSSSDNPHEADSLSTDLIDDAVHPPSRILVHGFLSRLPWIRTNLI